MEIDVHELHQFYVRGFRARGGVVVADAVVDALAEVAGDAGPAVVDDPEPEEQPASATDATTAAIRRRMSSPR